MKQPGKIIIPLVIICITICIAFLIIQNPPQNKRFKKKKSAQISVEVLELKPTTYEISINSFGIVKPKIQSMLVAQVPGKIVYVDPKFRAGGFFEQNDVLIKLDDRDSKAEVKIAQSSLVSAQQELLEEQARVQQAMADWQRLGNGQVADPLVLRQPQLAVAKSRILSAEAQLEKAKLSLERTEIIAPFAGRVLVKSVDFGQVVSTNTQLGEIYATDFVEIRLPINNKDLGLITLPEQYKGGDLTKPDISAVFSSQLVAQQTWQGKVVRTESAIDNDSQQLHVIAQINAPYDVKIKDEVPIKIGQYVNAKIKGNTLENALVIPNSAIYQGSYVYIVEAGVLKRKDITIRWENAQDALISDGLAFSDKLVLTPLGQVSSGTKVNVQSNEMAVKGEHL